MDSLVLIGMPGAGKSTLGRALADLRGRPFVDTDHLIERDRGRTLQSLLDELGYQVMRDLEAGVIVRASLPEEAVVATGGSVVYRNCAMQRLKREGLCVYLAISLETVKARVSNLLTRGFSRAPEQSLEDVYRERQLLYQRYADYTIQCDGRSERSVLAELDQCWGDDRSGGT